MLPGGPGAYVIRETRRTFDGRACYTVVDMAGRVSNVTLARELTLTELADPVIRHHVIQRAKKAFPR